MQAGLCALLQDCIAAAERILQNSKAEFSHMESYKSQLQLIWSREDVQRWLTLFTCIIADSQKALAAVVEASTNKDQVKFGAFVSNQSQFTISDLRNPRGGVMKSTDTIWEVSTRTEP